MIFRFVEPVILELGVVLFPKAISADWDLLMSNSWNAANEEQSSAYVPAVMPDTGEDALLNRSGFYYAKSTLNKMPLRATKLHSTQDQALAEQLDFLEDSRDKCLMQYMEIYPHAYKTIWWKIKGHVIIYGPGTHLGPHSDISSEFIYGVNTPSHQLHTRTVITAIVYFNSQSDTGEFPTFSGGSHLFNYTGTEYSPSEGDVLLFPTTFTATHEVRPVEIGRRFSYLGWYGQGTPNAEVHEFVHDPSSVDRKNNCTNVYMPQFRTDYISFLKNRGHDSSSDALRIVERLSYVDY